MVILDDGELDYFHSKILELLLAGIQAANKDVRIRSSQILSMYVNATEAFDDSQMLNLRAIISERIHDKNASVRNNCAIILCRLLNSGTEEEDEQIFDLLKMLIRHDPSRLCLSNSVMSEKLF
jgi:hypothetical protein